MADEAISKLRFCYGAQASVFRVSVVIRQFRLLRQSAVLLVTNFEKAGRHPQQISKKMAHTRVLQRRVQAYADALEKGTNLCFSNICSENLTKATQRVKEMPTTSHL